MCLRTAGFFILRLTMQIPRFILKWTPYALIAVLYAFGARLDIMEIDAAQYASISLEMLKSGAYLQVLDRFEDYLDKPPLLFWLSALSMKLFGIGTWQYKLPSILFSFVGILSTYKLGTRLYSAQIGRHASWIFGTSLAMIMINNDIKTDTILVSSIVLSIWMLVSYIETKQWKFLLGASVGIAIAMLTKGPIGLMMPALAIGGHILLNRKWNILWDWKWIPMLMVTGLLLLPMCIGLYQQYGTKGLEFYFWTQSFGRITGENVWRNDTTFFFFSHIFLWSFLPWTLLGILGVLAEAKNAIQQKANATEYYLISGIVLVWIAMSLSKFKLPHYIFVVYPLIAILAAKYLHALQKTTTVSRLQFIQGILLSIVLIVGLPYCFPQGGYWTPVLILFIAVLATVYYRSSHGVAQVIVPSFLFSLAIGVGLNLHFYPQLLTYQANAQVGKWIAAHPEHQNQFFGFGTGGRALDFYAGGVVRWIDTISDAEALIDSGTVVYASQARYQELQARGLEPQSKIEFHNFSVQRLTIPFLNPKTRAHQLGKNYLLFYE